MFEQVLVLRVVFALNRVCRARWCYLDGAAGVVSEDWVSEDEDQAVAHTGEQHRVIHAARDQARPHGQQTEQPPQSNQAAKAKQSNLKQKRDTSTVQSPHAEQINKRRENKTERRGRRGVLVLRRVRAHLRTRRFTSSGSAGVPSTTWMSPPLPLWLEAAGAAAAPADPLGALRATDPGAKWLSNPPPLPWLALAPAVAAALAAALAALAG